MHRITIFSIILFVCALHAEEFIHHVTVGPMISAYSVQSGDDYYDMIGAAGRVRFDKWGAELALNYRNEKVDNDKVWIKAWPVNLSALYFLHQNVYVLAGSGIYPLYIDYNQSIDYLLTYENEYKMSAGVHAGLGVDFRINELTSLALDVRYVVLDYRFETFPGSDDISANTIMASAIVHFNFTK